MTERRAGIPDETAGHRKPEERGHRPAKTTPVAKAPPPPPPPPKKQSS